MSSLRERQLRSGDRAFGKDGLTEPKLLGGRAFRHLRFVPLSDLSLTLLLDAFRLGPPHHAFQGENMMHRGLIGVVLYAMDLERLVEFYSSVAGLEPQAIEKGFAVLGTKPSQLVILRIPTRFADTIDIATPPEPREDPYQARIRCWRHRTRPRACGRTGRRHE